MKVLIVIDMLNGFCRSGYSLSLPQDTSKIEVYIENQIKSILAENGKVIFCCDSHTKDAPEFKQYPEHCLKGSIEAEIIDNLQQYAEISDIVEKNTLSIFYNTKLDDILSKIKVEEVEVVGVCTDICDLFAVFELRNRGYIVNVNQSGVLPLNPENQINSLTYYKEKLGANIRLKN